MTRAKRKAAGERKRGEILEKDFKKSEKNALKVQKAQQEQAREVSVRRAKKRKLIDKAAVQTNTLACLDTTKASLQILCRKLKVPLSDKRDVMIRNLARSVCERTDVNMELVRADFPENKKWWDRPSQEKAAICKKFDLLVHNVPVVADAIVERGAMGVAKALEALSIYGLAKKCADRDVKNITKRNKIEYITQIMNLYAQPSPTAAVSTTTTTSNPDVKTSAAETAADGADDEKAAEVEEEGKQND